MKELLDKSITKMAGLLTLRSMQFLSVTSKTEMLGLVLPFCRAFGESKVLVTCDKRNVASQRTIIKNGGMMENEIVDTMGLSKSGIIQRFWISI